jgi:hypothetical protein
MKSTIKIDVTGLEVGHGLQPVIRVNLDNESTDPRDGLINHFFQSLGGESSWLRANYMLSGPDDVGQKLEIFPVHVEQLPATVLEILDRIFSCRQSLTKDEAQLLKLCKNLTSPGTCERKDLTALLETLDSCEAQFTSKYGIGRAVHYRVGDEDSPKRVGSVIGVRFIEGETFYDIQDYGTKNLIRDYPADGIVD